MKTFNLFAISAALLVLAACGGSAQVSVALGSDVSAVSGPAATVADAQIVTVTVRQISVHVASDGEAPEAEGSTAAPANDAKEDATGAGWTVLSSTDQTVDLASVSGANAPQLLGQSTVPSGRVTQIRLELAPGQDNGDGTSRLPGAVTTGSETCDLVVPTSVFSPGLKILTPFRAENGTQNVASVLLDLRDSSRLGTASCAYFLNPVLKLEKVDTTRAPER